MGFTRPLEKDGQSAARRVGLAHNLTDSRTDLWELDDRRRADVVTDRLESNFYARCPPEKRPAHLRRRLSSSHDNLDDTTDKDDAIGTSGTVSAAQESQYDSSLPFAIQRTFFFHFWLAGFLYATGGAPAGQVIWMESDHSVRVQRP